MERHANSECLGWYRQVHARMSAANLDGPAVKSRSAPPDVGRRPWNRLSHHPLIGGAALQLDLDSEFPTIWLLGDAYRADGVSARRDVHSDEVDWSSQFDRSCIE